MKPITMQFKIGKTTKDVRELVLKDLRDLARIHSDDPEQLRELELELKDVLELIAMQKEQLWSRKQSWGKEVK